MYTYTVSTHTNTHCLMRSANKAMNHVKWSFTFCLLALVSSSP